MSLTEISVRGVRKPIVRYVYLVQDLSDAARMGGTSDNTYTTYQAAYNAADALQLLIPGSLVVILVGATTSAAVGNCSTPNWNSNVSLVGINSLVSRIGTTTITTVSAISMRVKDIGIGGVTSEGGITINMDSSQILLGTLNASSATGNGGNITVSGSNSNCSNVNTQSTAGNSGNIIFSLCSNMVIGSIFQTSSVGNVGSLAFSNVYNSTVGAITRTATSAVNNTTIGDFSIGNCENIIFQNTISISITNPLSTGAINIFIGRSNQSIMFSGQVNILGCTTGARSDVVIDLQFINCVFNNQVNVNNSGTFITERGGWIKRLEILDCKFYHRARFVNWPINPQTVDPVFGGDLLVNIKDCSFAKGINNAGFVFQNNDASYALFEIKNCESDDFNVGIAIQVNVTTPPVITFMLDGGFIDLQNIKSNMFIMTMDPVVNSAPENCVLNNCNGYAGSFETWEDFNYAFNFCNFENTGYGYGFGSIPLTKPFYIRNSRMASNGYLGFTINSGGIGVLDFVIKNSYFGFYTDILNPLTVSTSAVYNSMIESVADVGSTSSFTGTLFTSTIRRLVTEIVAGLTFNNSYDDAY